MKLQKIAEYGGIILPDGTLELRDPNDNAKHRYWYAWIAGEPCRRVLPDEGDYSPPERWESLDLSEMQGMHPGRYSPILDYFTSVSEDGTR